jgi:transposase InsO family protein
MRGERDVEKLRRWCIRRLLEDWSIRDVSAHTMTPKSTVHDWWMRFQRNGWVGLSDASRRPHTIHRLPEETVQKVLEVRQREGWCSEAIEAYLKAHGVQVSHGSIHTIVKQNHLPMRTYAPRKQRTCIRFQRAHPDSLWQTDITNYANQYLIAFIDDCSRYVPSASLCLEATTDNVLETLQEALSNGRTPKQILSDHGTQYWSNDGPGRFTSFCETHGIEHIQGSIGKPTTQGKIERFYMPAANM